MLGKKRICHSDSPVMSSLTYDSILVFAAHGSDRPNLYIMSTSPLSFLVVGVGQDFTCKWIGFRCEIRLITTACEPFPATVQIVPKTARSCSKITQ
uniref:Orf136 n=1 Tax=Bupleurum falcatum TaxID=46367 RepID=A0A288W779_BUPFA|nr:orf136 [Bupleurum falcatum]ARR27482.1 orf136 [Bupleurum falcatum]